MKPVLDLTRILLAHFLGDFLFLTKKGTQNKRQKKWRAGWLYIHAFLYAVLVSISFSAWKKIFWLLPALFVIHLIIDRIKVGKDENAGRFLLVQLSYLAALIGLWATLSPENFQLIKSNARQVWNSPDILLIVLGYVLILWPTGYLVGYLTKTHREKLTEQEARGLENAGFWIGCLERIFVYSFIISGYTEGIAFVAAAKSLFRFGEIKDPQKREETEYILIGSLLSIGLAMLTGYAVKTWTGS